MKQERRSGLALLHIHQEKEICIDSVIDKFAKKSPRRLEFVNVCSE